MDEWKVFVLVLQRSKVHELGVRFSESAFHALRLTLQIYDSSMDEVHVRFTATSCSGFPRLEVLDCARNSESAATFKKPKTRSIVASVALVSDSSWNASPNFSSRVTILRSSSRTRLPISAAMIPAPFLTEKSVILTAANVLRDASCVPVLTPAMQNIASCQRG